MAIIVGGSFKNEKEIKKLLPGKDYAVVVFRANQRLEIYADPRNTINPWECYLLRMNLTGAKKMHGDKRAFVVSKNGNGKCHRVSGNIYCQTCKGNS